MTPHAIMHGWRRPFAPLLGQTRGRHPWPIAVLSRAARWTLVSRESHKEWPSGDETRGPRRNLNHRDRHPSGERSIPGPGTGLSKGQNVLAAGTCQEKMCIHFEKQT
jgi:hypothetical protein